LETSAPAIDVFPLNHSMAFLPGRPASLGRPPTLLSVWRSEFAGKPTGSFFGFHRIDKLDHALVDVITSGTFKRSNVKASGTRGDAGQHGSCLARWAKGPQKNQDASPWTGGSTTLSVTGGCRDGTVMCHHGTTPDLAVFHFAHFRKVNVSARRGLV